MRRLRERWSDRSGAFLISAFASADANLLAFIDEGWNLHHQSGFELGGLGDVGDACAFETRLRFYHLEIHRWRQLDADRLAFIKLHVDFELRDQVFDAVAQ